MNFISFYLGMITPPFQDPVPADYDPEVLLNTPRREKFEKALEKIDQFIDDGASLQSLQRSPKKKNRVISLPDNIFPWEIEDYGYQAVGLLELLNRNEFPLVLRGLIPALKKGDWKTVIIGPRELNKNMVYLLDHGKNRIKRNASTSSKESDPYELAKKETMDLGKSLLRKNQNCPSYDFYSHEKLDSIWDKYGLKIPLQRTLEEWFRQCARELGIERKPGRPPSDSN